ncbi:MAG: hypothetical protein KF693_05190 [Nitrospira sp.]|nr:hypothetical protein [Nitrospira sp.]
MRTSTKLSRTSAELTTAAYQRLEHFLRRNTNPTEQQLRALHALMDNFSRLTHKEATGRYAWPLPVGFGKTSSACHYVAEAIKDGFSFVIACGQLQGLNDINKVLVTNLGVDQDLIGTLVNIDLHKDVQGTIAYQPEQFPILLVTHARVHMGKEQLERYWKYDGHERDLLIYDESLISSKSVISLITTIETALYDLEGRVNRRGFPISSPFLQFAQRQLEKFIDKHEELKRHAAFFKMDHPTHEVPNEFKHANITLDAMDADKFENDLAVLRSQTEWNPRPLLDFLELCGTEVRLALNDQGDSALSYIVTVPDDIHTMVILDASSPIRLLSQLDTKNRVIEATTLPLVQAAGITDLAALYDYSNVSWYCYKAGGGRSSFKNDKQNTRIKDCVGLLKKDIPQDDPVLFYVFKKQTTNKKEKDLETILKKELSKYAYDFESDTKRIFIETFGRETSSNSYRHCKHVVFVGTPWQHRLHLVANVLGQKRDIKIHIPDQQLHDIEVAEVAYRFHQGAGRGCMRQNGPDGRPQPMSVYCFLTDEQRAELLPLLAKVLPGMKTPEKRLTKGHQTTAKQDTVEAYIQERLAACSSHMTKTSGLFQMSTKALKRDLPIPVSIDTFTRALNNLLKKSPGWSKVSRSLVYKRPTLAA